MTSQLQRFAGSAGPRVPDDDDERGGRYAPEAEPMFDPEGTPEPDPTRRPRPSKDDD